MGGEGEEPTGWGAAVAVGQVSKKKRKCGPCEGPALHHVVGKRGHARPATQYTYIYTSATTLAPALIPGPPRASKHRQHSKSTFWGYPGRGRVPLLGKPPKGTRRSGWGGLGCNCVPTWAGVGWGVGCVCVWRCLPGVLRWFRPCGFGGRGEGLRVFRGMRCQPASQFPRCVPQPSSAPS
jgi:hypothetical protein